MHFWIDKRSPQCGFGRSRVAASLSGAGGGAGVSFGHPPRRTGGNKSSSAGVHRQQQQHHQQAQQPAAAQYHQHGGGSSASSGGGGGGGGGSSTYAAGATPASNTNYRSPNYPGTSSSGGTHSNNNNNSHSVSVGAATHTPTNRNHLRANNAHHYYNNNRQYQQQQQQQNQQQQGHHPTNPPNSSNNNHASTTTATTTMQNNLTSPTGNNVNPSSYTTPPLSSTTQPTSHHLQQQNPYQQQRYRHPQFGNMSVRTYPSSAVASQQQTSALTHNSNVVQQPPQSVDSTLNAMAENALQHQSPNQTANITTAELYQSSPRVVTVFPRPLSSSMPATCDHNSSTTNNTTGAIAPNTMRSMYGSTSTALHGNSRRRNVTRSIESADLQFLPLHLKCGIFASLVLAIAFIVGIKVYFDNHGTKFEVGLFWLLTATFVFAFCFVSICKVPRVLFATSSSSSRSGSRDQTVRDRCSLDDARGSVVNSIDDVVLSSLQEFQQQEILEQQMNQATQAQQQAGPPPYHIAILLPESKAKEEVEQVEESPPPSYDKILI